MLNAKGKTQNNFLDSSFFFVYALYNSFAFIRGFLKYLTNVEQILEQLSSYPF